MNTASRKLTLLPLMAVLFFSVSGGAYGLENLVGAAGPGMALLLIVVTPLIWSAPIALMVAELSAAIPDAGGYYTWVKRALGPFWGFAEGWLSWLTTWTALAVYPVLFARYLSALLVQQWGVTLLEDSELARWITAVIFIWTLAAVNIRGIRVVGGASVLIGVLVLAPFALLAVIGLTQLALRPVAIWEPFAAPDAGISGAFGMGLFVVMWNYIGWDSATTALGEIDTPRRNFPLALALTLPLVVLVYLLPTAAGLGAAPDWTQWSAGYFVDVGAKVGGAWLGVWIGFGALLSSVGLFNALLLGVSRLPFAMAADGMLPAAITRLHPRFGTPWASIVLCCAIFTVFALSALSSLIVIVVILYSAALALEFAAFVALRIRRPDLPRPFKVPGRWPGVVVICALPALVLGLAIVYSLSDSGISTLWLALGAIATTAPAYGLCRKFFKATGATPARVAQTAPPF